MKKGKQAMQIPIQSLNTKHGKKYEFGFDQCIYQYHLKESDLNEIQLVLANGEPFILNEGNFIDKDKKRVKKQTQK